MRSSATEPLVGVSAARSEEGQSWLANLWIASAFLFILSILVRLVDIGQLARFDELYTLLAARGWLAHGVPQIGGGAYERAELFTVFIAWCLRLFGDTMVVARLPSVLFGSLLAVAVFWWTHAVAGRGAAWIAGLFVALASMSVEMSQYARFYTLHALSFWLGATGVYALATGAVAATPRRLALVVGTALCLVCALYVQILTLFGLVALAIWLTLALLARWCRDARQFWMLLAVFALAAVLIVAAVLATSFGHHLLADYRATPMTNIEHKGQIWFYDLHLIERYPTLWTVFPFLALIAIAARPAPSLFALCIFGTIFALMSFGGPKSLHYLFFALPFLYVVFAIAVASLWPLVRTTVKTALEAVVAPAGPRLRPLLRWTLMIGSIGFLLLANGSTARTALRPLGIHLEQGFSADWPAAVPQLAPLVQSAGVVLTSHELHMLYYFGRADVVVSKERLSEVADDEFAIDPRTGMPVVSTPASVELMLACYPTGLIVTDTIKGWRAPTVIDDATANVIASQTTPIELPERWNLKAFRWDRPQGGTPPGACATIPGFK